MAAVAGEFILSERRKTVHETLLGIQAVVLSSAGFG